MQNLHSHNTALRGVTEEPPHPLGELRSPGPESAEFTTWRMGCIMVMVVSASVAAGMLLGEAFNRPQIPTGLLITIPSGNCVEPTPGQVLVVTVIHDGKPRLGECTTYTTQWKKRPGR